MKSAKQLNQDEMEALHKDFRDAKYTQEEFQKRWVQLLSRPWHYSRGIETLGADVVQRVISTAAKHYNGLRVVSVGSGSAMMEYSLPDIHWVLVDPQPKSFIKPNEEPYIMPDYDYVKTLVASDPSIVGNCLVFLNWCDPMNCDGYDLEAIQLLDPVAIIVVFEVCGPTGAAGTIQFHQWRRTQKEYLLAHSVTLDVPVIPYKEVDVRMYWYAKTSLPSPSVEDLPTKVPPRRSITSTTVNCVIS